MWSHGKQNEKLDAAMLRTACIALTELVRREYPRDLSLCEIAEIWGDGLDNESVEALRALERDPLVREVGFSAGHKV